MANVAVVTQQDGPNVAHAVKAVARFRGKTNADIAKALFLSEGQVSKRMSGQIQFRADELQALGELLDVQPGVFFLTTAELIRSRCFASVAAIPGQGTLPLVVNSERPTLAAV